MTTQYDRAAFIRAFIQANQPHYLHDDFKIYYAGLLNALQQAFGFTLASDSVRDPEVRALWMLFRATVQSYLSIRNPRSNFADDSLINVTLERLDERAKPISALEATIQQATSTNATAHLQLLDELFVLLWGPTTQVITSDDLRQFGFDDTKEPQFRDYLDYL